MASLLLLLRMGRGLWGLGRSSRFCIVEDFERCFVFHLLLRYHVVLRERTRRIASFRDEIQVASFSLFASLSTRLWA